jgi:hypothetical protein
VQVVELTGQSESLTLRQRWAHVFTLLIALVLLLFGLNLRNNILNATSTFISAQAGVEARYPQGWLLDTNGDYVFRVRDMTRTGYKTTMQVAIRPVGPDSTERNVAERLGLDRATGLTAYQPLSTEPYRASGDLAGQALTYTYVSQQSSPFLEGIPSVVRGFDVITISGGQAIIITFRADESLFDAEFPRFERFLRSLVF